jgi:hypothetical protein
MTNDDRFTEVQRVIYDRVAELTPKATIDSLLKLAEAFAWASAPGQPHGSSHRSE